MSGIDLQNQRGQAAADPISATDLVNKQYVDNLVNGLSWKDEVVAASTTNGTLATAYENGDLLDGITLATGNRILLKDQTDQKENGIYVVAASGAPTRATDADSTTELNNAVVRVLSGSVNQGRSYTQTTVSPVITVDNIVWARNDTTNTYVAGSGLTESPSLTFNVGNTDGSITVSADAVALASQVAGAGLTLTAGVLDVVGDASITVGANSLGLASGVAGTGLTLTTGVLDVVAGDGITANANDIAVNSTVARYYSTAIHSSGTAIVITHSLGRKTSLAAVRITSTDERIYPDIVATSTTTTTFTFGVSQSANTLTFEIVG